MSNSEMKTVTGVDLKRYMGRWYEIASIPSRFQPRDGTNTRATYTLEADGATVRVLNETWSGGKRGFIEGTAYKADPTSDEAKLKVKFWVPPFLPVFPVTGDYWVLELGENYEYALVGQPSRRYLWVLCRKPVMEEELYKMLLEKAVEQGYDVSKLVKTPQDEVPPEGDDGPKDTKGFWWIKSVFGK
ncbi:temperature-induced lipocalin-1 [Silene latifolia]|uniref:temperature-induced lipocalin-1 n=1 Tax=Silene latifolia TaxID=37657 RepID=UPI003D770701